MIVTDTIRDVFKNNSKQPWSFIWTVLVILILTVVVTQTVNIYYSKIYSKEETPIIRQIKTEVQATGKDPCDILTDMLSDVQPNGDTKLKRDIVKAQKYFGCRNRQKRGVR